ncbi:Sec23/Sec24 protein transport family protein isoform 3 [Hibiscus syriacus]|uniref:Protein transport protein SEC23 n=1 Tax=Hibiscus syriacus TaxID=106335 RepID=A0A6A2ZQ47_HIBSY|nr:Sec23/Sec24 protein transport family protein isoform 3 [Hibiscus syriacus]
MMDYRSSRLDKSPIVPAPPTISPGSPRFPLPDLQQDQAPSSSTKYPTMLSPANGVKTGSSVHHLSTPPAPPVFTSPVRPAAVPFRTSPATPQPTALSSGSSLPTSSPRYFSNGSVGAQQQLPSAIEEPVPDGKSPCVLFSAHKVLKHKKQANVPSLGFGVLVSSGRENSPGPQVVQRDPHRCHDCGAYSNLYSNILIGSGQWQCVICGNLNGSEGEYIALSKEELRHFPDLSSAFVDYIQPGNKRPCFVPVTDSRTSAMVVLVIDECLDEPHLQHFQSSLHALVDSFPSTTRIEIILYGHTVSVYEFSEESVASAEVIPEVAHLIFSSLRPYKLNVPEASRDRCLGAAVEVALAIIQGPSADFSRGVVKRPGVNSRIIVCAGGPNTYGPESVPYSYTHPNYPHKEKSALKWMEHLGREAHQQNTVVDILCAGTCPVRVPVLLPLAKASGGAFVLHDDFSKVFGMNLQRASARAAGSHGLLEIRCSDDILITQFSIQYTNVYQADITRVVTIRLPTVDSVPEYLQSIEDKVAAVLIAKRTLLGAKSYSDAIDMRTTIDERVKNIALKFSCQVPKSELHRFPKEISLLPELLFHLRRGPLLGNIVGHEDERSVLRNLFLNASFDLSLLMVAPRCLRHREGGTFEELPAYDLVMQSDTALVLDHGTDVFVWLEGSSQARYFVSRLIPAHKDPPYEQEARFPQLRTLTTEQRMKLKNGFIHFDDPSFCEWIRSLNVVPPEPF